MAGSPVSTRREALQALDITPRQREVLDLLAQRKTNAQIAESLGISLDGANWHVSEIITRLGVDSREEAAELWRQHNGARARFGRFVHAAVGVSLARRIAIGAGVAAVAAVVVGALVLSRGGDEAATPDSTPTPVSETPGASVEPTASASPTAAETAAPSQQPNDPLADATIVELNLGEAMAIPAGMILYYRRACYACGPGLELWRAYVDASGQLHDRPLSMVLVGQSEDGRAIRPDSIQQGETAWAATVCTGYCGGESEATEGSTSQVWFSYDGGITWEPGNPVPLWTTIAGEYRGDWLLQTWRDGAMHYSLYSSGDAIEPPVELEDPYAFIAPSGELIWTERSAGWDELYREDGSPIGTSTAWARTYYPGPDDSPSIITSTRGGITALHWFEGSWAGASFLADEGLVAGYGEIPYELYPPGTAPPRNSIFDKDVRAVFISTADGTVHPIAGLPRGPDPGENINWDFSYPEWVELIPQRRLPLRVATEGDCLNVRESPSTEAAAIRCYVDDVLLFERETSDAPPEGWVAVRTPDGREGFASTEFLVQ